MKSLTLLLLIASCSTTKARMGDEKPKPGHDEWAEVDKRFCDEVDACFAPYRKCKADGKQESVCFPPHEECVIKAYRKWKKARGFK